MTGEFMSDHPFSVIAWMRALFHRPKSGDNNSTTASSSMIAEIGR
jgi:hypothetical protein